MDVATDLFPLDAGQRCALALASTLDPSGAPCEGHFGAALQRGAAANGGGGLLSDGYDYVMHGRVFRSRDVAGPGGGGGGGERQQEVLVSCGGLILQLTAPPGALVRVKLDANVYVLCRRA